MPKIFDFVYRSLKWLEELSGFSYEAINIIIWFILLPTIFVLLIERILKTNYLKIAFVLIVLITLLVTPDFEVFSKTLFQKSVAFLNGFEYLGLNYIQASVLVCVILPLLVILTLVCIKKSKRS
jgi:hypothetical protein